MFYQYDGYATDVSDLAMEFLDFADMMGCADNALEWLETQSGPFSLANQMLQLHHRISQFLGQYARTSNRSVRA